MIERRNNVQVFASRERLVERRGFGDVSDAPLDFNRLLDHVVPRNARASVVRLDHAGQNFDRRRLASAIRSQESKYLARSDTQRESLQREMASVVTPQPLGLDHAAGPSSFARFISSSSATGHAAAKISARLPPISVLMIRYFAVAGSAPPASTTRNTT